ncbi:MAG: DUF4332 domain-containing protein [Spirochaetes bacterium]|nr:DUF4332 domain-containing protein [Spirochaetota bacterium]
MGYVNDFTKIPLDQFKNKLKKRVLIPSQMILKEGIDSIFLIFEQMNIQNIGQLFDLLKQKDKFKELSQNDPLSENYLTVLFRHIKGKQPKPRKLEDFTWVDDEVIGKLQNEGLKNTKQLYDFVLKQTNITDVIHKIGLHKDEFNKLLKQTDLTRIQWVSPTFAHVLYEAGYDTVKKVQAANRDDLYHKIIKLNKEKELYKGKIGLNDMQICIEAAQDIEQEITYQF